MNYADIKNFLYRCNTHPDHQNGMITRIMIKERLHEEVEELREYIEGRKWVGLTDDEINSIEFPESGTATMRDFVRIIEAKLKEKNT